ncbi:MAG: Fatty acid desaturase, partial [uncultured Solirubrobacterales bacterium]
DSSSDGGRGSPGAKAWFEPAVLARRGRRLRAPGPQAQRSRSGHLGRPLPSAARRDVPRARGLLPAHARALGARCRVPAAQLHRLPRLRSRVVPALEASEPVGRTSHGAARVLALRGLAPRPRRPPRHCRRPRPPRGRRPPDADRRRVRGDDAHPAARVSAVSQPARDVRDRTGLCARRAAALRAPLRAAADPPQRHAHQSRDRRRGRPGLLADRVEGVPDRAVARGADGRRGGRVAVLRPASVRGRLLGEHRRLELRRRGPARQLLPQAPAGAALLHRQHRLSPRAPPERAHPQLQPSACSRREPDLPRRADPLAVGRPAYRPAQAVGRGSRPARDLRRGARPERRRPRRARSPARIRL